MPVSQNLFDIGVDLQMQTLLAIAVPQDRGILILGSSRHNAWANEGLCLDLTDMSLKLSKFHLSVGPINDWQNSHQFYD